MEVTTMMPACPSAYPPHWPPACVRTVLVSTLTMAIRDGTATRFPRAPTVFSYLCTLLFDAYWTWL
jgi:hypothetical protein